MQIRSAVLLGAREREGQCVHRRVSSTRSYVRWVCIQGPRVLRCRGFTHAQQDRASGTSFTNDALTYWRSTHEGRDGKEGKRGLGRTGLSVGYRIFGQMAQSLLEIATCVEIQEGSGGMRLILGCPCQTRIPNPSPTTTDPFGQVTAMYCRCGCASQGYWQLSEAAVQGRRHLCSKPHKSNTVPSSEPSTVQSNGAKDDMRFRLHDARRIELRTEQTDTVGQRSAIAAVAEQSQARESATNNC